MSKIMKTMTSEEYLDYRTKLFEETVLDMVEHICEELINDPDGVRVEYSVKDTTAALSIFVAKDKIPEILGKKNETLVSLKKLAFCVANKHDFFLTIKVLESE